MLNCYYHYRDIFSDYILSNCLGSIRLCIVGMKACIHHLRDDIDFHRYLDDLFIILRIFFNGRDLQLIWERLTKLRFFHINYSFLYTFVYKNVY